MGCSPFPVPGETNSLFRAEQGIVRRALELQRKWGKRRNGGKFQKFPVIFSGKRSTPPSSPLPRRRLGKRLVGKGVLPLHDAAHEAAREPPDRKIRPLIWSAFRRDGSVSPPSCPRLSPGHDSEKWFNMTGIRSKQRFSVRPTDRDFVLCSSRRRPCG